MRRLIALSIAAVLLIVSTPRLSGQVVTRLSVDPSGLDSNDGSSWAQLSLDGEVVSFLSAATNLIAGDTNFVQDTFVRLVDSGVTELVSVDSSGVQANGASADSSIDAEGNLIAFTCYATNLVVSDTNGVSDVFVRDRSAGTTERVSVDSSGGEGNGDSANAAISQGNGRYVAFDSEANNLVAGDTNGDRDVFVHDRWTGTTIRVSESTSGTEGNGDSFQPTISWEGHYIAFNSAASNLVASDTNGDSDIFLHDTQTGTTTRVSVDSSGDQANGWSFSASISGNGESVAFYSWASNLVTGDTNGTADIFVRDWVLGETERVSVSSSGVEGNFVSDRPYISTQGLTVTFVSFATNLVPGDTNGYNDVFVHDRVSGATVRASTDADGAQADQRSFNPTLDLTGSSVAFGSYATNLVPDGDTNGLVDIYIHKSPSVEFPLQPAAGESVAFALHDAPSEAGYQVFFLVSCSGTDGFQLGLHTVPLTFDACTQVSIELASVLMGTIDANGDASSPTFTFPQVPVGTELAIAAVTRSPIGFSTVTKPLIVRSQ